MASVRERGSGKGRKTWSVLYREDGKQRSTTFSDAKSATKFKRYVDLHGPAKARALYELEITSSAPTLDQWAKRHIDNLTGVTDGTRTKYRRMYKSAWTVPLGRYPIDAITREMIQGAIRRLDEGWADKTIRNHFGLLAGMMESAALAEIIPGSPCRRMKMPRKSEHTEEEMRFLTHDEWAQLLDAVPDYYQPMVITMAGTGCRWGEVEALTVADVDTVNATLLVKKAAKYDPSKADRKVGPTKTKRSRRTVTLPPLVVNTLKPLLDRPRNDRLFVDEQGRHIDNRRFWDVWDVARRESGIAPPLPRLHDLRHSHASWLIAQGIPLPVIQARLGHSSITTTINTYGHLVPELQLAAAHAAAVALAPGPTAAIES